MRPHYSTADLLPREKGPLLGVYKRAQFGTIGDILVRLPSLRQTAETARYFDSWLKNPSRKLLLHTPALFSAFLS